ncbi:MAG: peptide chain release factor 3 [Proteobacteria bacterium]|nr:peptide chain release factor 3 [Pseudomonadota bacterium]
MDLLTEAGRRRTFAIISHPDAGKTTLTEKLLLYSGAIHLAGSIRSRKAVRHAVSDWMQMEQERGISITSSVLQFGYQGRALNLLDTPGHADFSEDTYRTLAAVDSAVMLIDHTKGVESRTRRLFEVCRLRNLPIITFMNKLDREGLDPLGLIDEVSATLNLQVVPRNWPLGGGRSFRGIIDIPTGVVSIFSGGEHGSARADIQQFATLEEARDELGDEMVDEVAEQLELLELAGAEWDVDSFIAGETSPVFWGSAMNNYGVEPLLEFVAETAPGPAPRQAEGPDGTVEVTADQPFSGFVFKVQANMNPRHRDRVAFIRVVSGQFERGMEARLGRSNEVIRMSKPHTFMAGERSIVEEAFPGDIVGLYDPGKLRIGDTLSAGPRLRYGGIPRFAPEFFSRVVLEDPLKRKQLDQGLEQLGYEGVIQVFLRPHHGRQSAWLGAVGVLQFEVLKARLENEYKVKARLERLDWRIARWITHDPSGGDWWEGRGDYALVQDRNECPVVLVKSPWALDFAQRKLEGLELSDVEPL